MPKVVKLQKEPLARRAVYAIRDAIFAGEYVPGQRVVEAAKRDGSWEALDAVEDLRVPDDLALALAGNPVAEANFQAFTASARKAALWWITSAKRPETRAKRVAETVRLAAENLTVAARPHRRS